jgi:hypothetical protein
MATVSLLQNRNKLCVAESPKLVETEGVGLPGTGKLPLPSGASASRTPSYSSLYPVKSATDYYSGSMARQ